MGQYRKKPVVVEAEQFWPDKPLPFSPDPYVALDPRTDEFYVVTIHGQDTYLAPGDWVIKEAGGEFRAYPCKPDIFETIYEVVD